ncbi:uncharacterized protein LACBIDRAFT_310464 [Laccaria bicolor S238N-H82]|uniref:Predicted protein n=1 Tax=Laccaria bicolor (strain S238N-H82 / ATCC MYA-4686) TaxID=486041 RepID=B0DUE3_LACBS|nr:uncharacterized protein LACBIDRAFT_310464 [Laccaria bicolor S238N-H82]EDR01788.1 predicted protein [Laccaria bicolor S238N-H82]|eukprot:XP_001887601.1 predicted protein [Laccaria bicolor S238N-H82]
MCGVCKYHGVFLTTIFSPSVAFLSGRAHALIVSYPYYYALSATLQASLGPSARTFIDAFSGYPFIHRTTTRRTTHVLKHPGYWCYPGVESRSFTGAWAGRQYLMIVGGLLEGLRHRLTGRGTADNGEAAVGCFCF